MTYEVHLADPENGIVMERKWEVTEDGRFCTRFHTEEEAREFADSMQVESECTDYIREEFAQIIMQVPHMFEQYSQNDIRDLIRQVADEGGY